MDWISFFTAATPFVTAIGVLIIGVLTAINNFQASARAQQIALLERNTNSIKDALITTTGDAEHAKGVLQGRAEMVESARPTGT